MNGFKSPIPIAPLGRIGYFSNSDATATPSPLVTSGVAGATLASGSASRSVSVIVSAGTIATPSASAFATSLPPPLAANSTLSDGSVAADASVSVPTIISPGLLSGGVAVGGSLGTALPSAFGGPVTLSPAVLVTDASLSPSSLAVAGNLASPAVSGGSQAVASPASVGGSGQVAGPDTAGSALVTVESIVVTGAVSPFSGSVSSLVSPPALVSTATLPLLLHRADAVARVSSVAASGKFGRPRFVPRISLLAVLPGHGGYFSPEYFCPQYFTPPYFPINPIWNWQIERQTYPDLIPPSEAFSESGGWSPNGPDKVEEWNRLREERDYLSFRGHSFCGVTGGLGRVKNYNI